MKGVVNLLFPVLLLILLCIFFWNLWNIFSSYSKIVNTLIYFVSISKGNRRLQNLLFYMSNKNVTNLNISNAELMFTSVSSCRRQQMERTRFELQKFQWFQHTQSAYQANNKIGHFLRTTTATEPESPFHYTLWLTDYPNIQSNQLDTISWNLTKTQIKLTEKL